MYHTDNLFMGGISTLIYVTSYPKPQLFPLCSQKKLQSSVGPSATNQEDDFGVLQQLEIGEQVGHNACVHVYIIIVVWDKFNVTWSPCSLPALMLYARVHAI